MTKFKVGDRVKIVMSDEMNTYIQFVGQVGRVISISGNVYPYYVRVDSNPIKSLLNECELEAVHSKILIGGKIL